MVSSGQGDTETPEIWSPVLLWLYWINNQDWSKWANNINKSQRCSTVKVISQRGAAGDLLHTVFQGPASFPVAEFLSVLPHIVLYLSTQEAEGK